MKRLSYKQIMRAFNDFEVSKIEENPKLKSIEWRKVFEFVLFLERYFD